MPRPPIGPRIQAHVYEKDWEVVEALMVEDGLKMSAAIRRVFSMGAKRIRKQREGK